MSFTTSGMNAWRGFRLRSCTGCAKAGRTPAPRRLSTHPATQVAIGERRRPEPQNQPGYLRVDTVHQGDRDGVKGLYHINVVDEVTQWEVVSATAQISEAWLLPVLEAMLDQFPFRIRGFHSDNGSEFINHAVAGLLESCGWNRPSRGHGTATTTDWPNRKNGWVIRKHIGYGHIASVHAEAFDSSTASTSIHI